MSQGWKIALIVFACLLFLVIGTCGACYFFVQSNKDEFIKQGQAAKKEASEFAASHTDDECIGSALAKLDACEGKGPIDKTMCDGMVNVYLESCMHEAKPTDSLCQGVPRMMDFMESAKWALNACTLRQRAGNDACGRMMQAVIRVCEVRTAKKAG